MPISSYHYLHMLTIILQQAKKAASASVTNSVELINRLRVSQWHGGCLLLLLQNWPKNYITVWALVAIDCLGELYFQYLSLFSHLHCNLPNAFLRRNEYKFHYQCWQNILLNENIQSTLWHIIIMDNNIVGWTHDESTLGPMNTISYPS